MSKGPDSPRAAALPNAIDEGQSATRLRYGPSERGDSADIQGPSAMLHTTAVFARSSRRVRTEVVLTAPSVGPMTYLASLVLALPLGFITAVALCVRPLPED